MKLKPLVRAALPRLFPEKRNDCSHTAHLQAQIPDTCNQSLVILHLVLLFQSPLGKTGTLCQWEQTQHHVEFFIACENEIFQMKQLALINFSLSVYLLILIHFSRFLFHLNHPKSTEEPLNQQQIHQTIVKNENFGHFCSLRGGTWTGGKCCPVQSAFWCRRIASRQ